MRKIFRNWSDSFHNFLENHHRFSKNGFGDPPNPVRGLSEHSLLLGDAARRGLLPQETGVPGVGLKTVVFACFPGLFPPRGRETQTLCLFPPLLDCFSTVRPGFPGKARVWITAPGASFQRAPQFDGYSILMRAMAILKDGPFLCFSN